MLKCCVTPSQIGYAIKFLLKRHFLSSNTQTHTYTYKIYIYIQTYTHFIYMHIYMVHIFSEMALSIRDGIQYLFLNKKGSYSYFKLLYFA